MSTTTTRPARLATPERWQSALARALTDGVRVVEVNATGQWIALSGSDAGTAYALKVTGNIAHGCSCPAGQHGDPVCRHRAAWYHQAGLLDPEPDPTPPAPPAAAPVAIIVLPDVVAPSGCPTCCGQGVEWSDVGAFQCAACVGSGLAVAPAAPMTCADCAGSGARPSLFGGQAVCHRCRGSGAVGAAPALAPGEIAALTAYRDRVLGICPPDVRKRLQDARSGRKRVGVRDEGANAAMGGFRTSPLSRGLTDGYAVIWGAN